MKHNLDRHRLRRRWMLAGLMAWLFLIPFLSSAQTMRTEPAPLIDIVLVHGAFADGSSWSKVIALLQRKGYHVTAVQNPLSSLAADVAATSRVIARQPHPVLLVGHSWGGAVISEAGNQEKVKGLVYLSALAPDSGESVAQALQRLQAPMQGLQPDHDGLIWLDDPKVFAQVMAHDVAVDQVRALAAVQQPIAASAFAEPVMHAAWHDKPGWYLVTQGDHALSTAVQQQFAAAMKAQTETIVSSHLSLVSHPRQVADLIDRAARSLH
ncbi:alpha/beta fold hydrolase [Herbaspirillum sp. WGmk3]|uniref:alpha/beta fold hydrolase n=1 Tax=Herbaspirillum sp. WGmk3 TaxID=2919925 RepID=UPI0035323CC0